MSTVPTQNVPELRFPEFESDWQWKPLKALSSKSISYGIVQTGIPVVDGVKCVRVVDLTKPQIDFNELITTSEKISQSYKKTILVAGEIMVALRGEIGLVAEVPKELEGSNLTRGIARIAPKKSEVLSSYLLWALRSPEGRREFRKQVNGSALKEIPIGGLNKIKVQLTTLSEQRKIAAFLGAVDAKLDALRRKRALLADYKRGVMQQIFTQAVRFVSADGSPFPDWVEVRLEDLGELVGGLTYSPSDIRPSGLLVLRSSNVQNEQITLDDCVYVGVQVSERSISKAGDILICVRNGSTRLIGKNAVIPDSIPYATHGAFMTVFRGNNNKFVSHLFKTPAYYRQVHADLGARINSINSNRLRRYKFVVPKSHQERENIADFLTAIDKKIIAVDQQIEQVATFKKGLLQQMFV